MLIHKTTINITSSTTIISSIFKNASHPKKSNLLLFYSLHPLALRVTCQWSGSDRGLILINLKPSLKLRMSSWHDWLEGSAHVRNMLWSYGGCSQGNSHLQQLFAFAQMLLNIFWSHTEMISGAYETKTVPISSLVLFPSVGYYTMWCKFPWLFQKPYGCLYNSKLFQAWKFSFSNSMTFPGFFQIVQTLYMRHNK